jgi:hypothetical protein
MIMVIVITGILSGMVAVFIKGPVESYFDMARRAELTDVADTAVRRMARDIRSSVPNTLRNPTDGSDQCIEFVPAKAGARYRADQAAPLTPTCPGAAPCGDNPRLHCDRCQLRHAGAERQPAGRRTDCRRRHHRGL